MKNRAFSLVELLVTIAIIAVLIAMIGPSLSKVREASRSANCLSNLSQLHKVGFAHAMDTRTMILSHSAIKDSEYTEWYGAVGSVWTCPSDPLRSNVNTLGFKCSYTYKCGGVMETYSYPGPEFRPDAQAYAYRIYENKPDAIWLHDYTHYHRTPSVRNVYNVVRWSGAALQQDSIQ